jgi:hypothetical protein
MSFSASSLAAALGANPTGTPTANPPNSTQSNLTTTTTTAAAASSSTTTSIPTDAANSSVPTNAKPNTTTITDLVKGINAATIRKADDISPSPIRVSTRPPSRTQDPPKHQRTSVTSRATKFFLRDLTTIDPPEVQAYYPIFKFGKTNKSSPTSTGDSATVSNPSTNNGDSNNSTSTPDDNQLVIKTPTLSNTNESNLDPASPTTGAGLTTSLQLSTNDTPSKQLDFSIPTDHDSTPLSSVKMAPIKKRTSASSINSSSSTQTKSSTKSKVIISPNAPDVRRYDKTLPATAKDPEITDITLPPHIHKFKTVFELAIKIPKTEKVLHELSTKMLSALAFMQKYADPTAAFLPKTNSELPHICNKLSFPTVIFPLEEDYFVFSTPSWHYAAKGIRGKIIRLSVIIGTDVEPERIARCKPDLNTMNVGIEIKPHQDIDTNTRIALLGAPNTINKTEAKKLCLEIFQSALSLHQVEHPEDEISSTVTIPDFAIILTQPQGLPYVAQDDSNEKYTPPAKERRCLHVMCNSSDFEGFAKLTEVAKANDLWRPSFGMCYPAIVPQVDCDPDRLDRYIRMIDIHESVQRCIANTVISGLSNVDKQFTLRKDDGTTATFTARELLAHIKVWDPIPQKFVPVFLCLLRRDDHRFHAYYPGGNGNIQTYVDDFRKCPGPQLYFYLLKRRFLHGDVSKFIRSVFNLEQQALCSRAKYSKRTGMAYVQNKVGEMDIIDAAMASDNGIIVDTVRRSPALQPVKYNGPKNSAIEYYDFAEGQSITTIRTTTKDTRKAASDNSIGIGKSVYEPEGSVAVSTIAPDDMDIDEKDEIGDDEFGNEFVFDLAALKVIEQQTLSKINEQLAPPATEQNTNPPADHGSNKMSDDDAKAIQDQLTLSIISRTKIADALCLGDANNNIDIPDEPNFAVVLEDLTMKNYNVMLEIIDSIMASIKPTDQDEQPNTIPDHVEHVLFTSALRDALAADLAGSEDSLTDYLECMRMAIEGALKITEGYMAPSETQDDEVMLLETEQPLSLLPAAASGDSVAKLQGCTNPSNTQATTEGTVGEVGIVAHSTSRLGADQE